MKNEALVIDFSVVSDAQDHLVGITTHDDALDVMEAQATEDFHRIATITKLYSSVATASVPKLYRARISWLMLLGLSMAAAVAAIPAAVSTPLRPDGRQGDRTGWR